MFLVVLVIPVVVECRASLISSIEFIEILLHFRFMIRHGALLSFDPKAV